MRSEIAIAGQFGSAAAHPINQAVKREGHRFDRFRLQIDHARNCLQGAFVPPAEMMRRRIEHEIRDLGQRRCPAGHDNAQPSTGSDAFYQIAGEVQWVGHVLDGVKGADDVVFFGM